jgi:predicted transposase YdaD
MAKPFDAATKRLVEADPLAWLHYAGLPGTQANLIDADFSTVTSDADRVIHVQTPEYLAHIELQSAYKTDMSERVLLYNVLAHCKYKLPVQSVLILLRREADGPAMSGKAGYEVPQSQDGSLNLRYRVVRVWEKAVEEVLRGELATLPLAPLAHVSENELPEVVRQMEARIDTEASAEDAGMLWTTTFLLMGLKYERELTRQLLKGVRAMKESTTYQAILEEGEERGILKGRIQAMKEILLRQGTRRFGAPDAQTQSAIEAIASTDVLEALIDRVFDVESWEDLFARRRGT